MYACLTNIIRRRRLFSASFLHPFMVDSRQAGRQAGKGMETGGYLTARIDAYETNYCQLSVCR
jgi:hypothetical protein